MRRVVGVALFAFALPLGAANVALVPKIGTAGYGVDLTFGAPSLQGRVGAATGSYSRTIQEEDLEYEGDLKLRNYSALIDFYPGGGAFRLSAGVLSNDNRIDLLATGTGTYLVDGVPYEISRIGTITGDVRFNRTSPYVGIGFGNPLRGTSRVSVTLDVGAIHQGSPKLHLQANPTNPALVPPQFYEDLESERARTEEELSEYKYYPVVALGLVIRF
jgi:hypothetical protein